MSSSYRVSLDIETDDDNLPNEAVVERELIDALEDFPGSVYLRGIRTLALDNNQPQEGR